MILAVDMGNSVTTGGMFSEEGKLRFRSELPTVKGGTQDQYAIQLLDVFRLHRCSAEDVTGAILSSVVPPATAALCGAVRFLTGKAPMVMGPGVRTGLNIKSDLHAQLGSDIVAFSIAAAEHYPSPLIVIDMGTAVTMSLLRGNVYEGCIIMPGVCLSVEALSQEAAELPHISIQAPAALLGHNTVDAMRSGVVYGSASMIDGMIDRVEEVNGGPVAAVVATGSNAPEVLHYCKHTIVYDADLILHGLYLIYRKNTAPRQRKGS